MIRRLGKKVRRLRERAGMSQTELAQRLGMRSKGYISEVESGKKLPPPEKILQIADIFHVTTDYLMRDSLPDQGDPEDHAAHTDGTKRP